MERSLEITASRLDSVANAPNSTNSTCSKSPLLLGTCVSLTLGPCKDRWSRTNVPFSATKKFLLYWEIELDSKF